MSEAQRDDEPFDLVDETGAPLGRTKARAAVHRDGDWHRALHLWVVHDEAPAPWVLLQRRGRAKDTWPLRVDVSVGGHLAAGEDVLDALREAEEEIGLTVTREALRWLGRVAVSRALPEGGADREVLDVFATRSTRALTDYRPHPAELDELLAVSLDDALALWRGARAEAPARAWRGDVVRAVTLRADALCGPDGGLRARALGSVSAWLRGEDPAPWPFP